ncbi:hypothetical protein [Embleya hyalina]|uniref:Uncharacterized protein n=1 Tax=Embleya hyalina TaxID=516124 RepID=A0A401YN45_9ACTN|nr:hypothetical protein [Embleya hyalina]GCD96026.1 hypothetical protein EHYA_03710 [Embleya hyalina]
MHRKLILLICALPIAGGCDNSSLEKTTAAKTPTSSATSAPQQPSAPTPPPTLGLPPSPTTTSASPTRRAAPSPIATTPSKRSSTPAGGNTRPTGTQGLDCGGLLGSGTFTDPHRLGVVDGHVSAKGCGPLTSGSPFNTRYFSFKLTATPGANAHAGASFTLVRGAISPVYPAIVQPNGFILKHSLGSGYWTGTEPGFTGRYQIIADLSPGTYILRVEKLDSPLRSITTPSYDIEVDSGPS